MYKSYRNWAIHLLILLLISHTFACGQWKPATVADLRASAAKGPKAYNDEYRFPRGEKDWVKFHGRQLKVEGEEVFIESRRESFKPQAFELERLEKFQLDGKKTGLVIGASVGGGLLLLLGIGFAAWAASGGGED
jgi:hypothetical protein